MDSIGSKVVCSIKGAITRGIMLCLILCATGAAWADIAMPYRLSFNTLDGNGYISAINDVTGNNTDVAQWETGNYIPARNYKSGQHALYRADGLGTFGFYNSNGLAQASDGYCISFWFYYDTVNAWNSVLAFRIGNENYGLEKTDANNTFHIYTGGGSTLLNSTVNIANGGWHHIALVIDPNATSGRIYVDGTEGPSFNMTDRAGNLTRVAPGRRVRGDSNDVVSPGGGVSSFVVDELAIYTGTVTAADVSLMANRSCAALPLVAGKTLTVSANKTWSEVLTEASISTPDNEILTITAENNPTITFDSANNKIGLLKVTGAVTFKADDSLYEEDSCFKKTLLSGNIDASDAGFASIRAGWKGHYIKESSGILLYAQDREVISINIGGGNATAESSHSNLLVSGSDYYGLYPVPGNSWNNISGQWQSQKTKTLNSAMAYDGENTSTRDTVTLSGTCKNTWQWGNAIEPFLRGYFDDGSGISVQVTGVPYSKYDVIIYALSDSSLKIAPFEIDETEYTCGSDGIATVTTTHQEWGDGQYRTAFLGKSAMIIKDVTQPNLTIKGARRNSGARATICAVQIINQGVLLDAVAYSANVTGDVTWSTKAGLADESDTWVDNAASTISLVNNQEDPVDFVFDGLVTASSFTLSGSGKTAIRFGGDATVSIGSYSFVDVTGEVAINDAIRNSSPAIPASGTLRYAGSATLSEAPYAATALSSQKIVIDQPLTISELHLGGVKNEYSFGPNCNAVFSSRFVLGDNSNGSNQTVNQYGGSIVVQGTNEPNTGNQASILLGHYGSLTVNLNNLGGTFTATGAATKLGHTGKCYWTIGDGASANDTAIVTLKGVLSPDLNGYGNVGAGSKLTIAKGGTLNIGASGIDLPESSSVELAGGRLVASSDSSISISAGTISATAETTTELSTANNLTVGSAMSGSGNITKTGAGTLILSASATTTGMLTVSAGTLELSDGVTWGGNISVGPGAVLNLNSDVDVNRTYSIPICAGLLTVAEGGSVLLKGESIDLSVWQFNGSSFKNSRLSNLTTSVSDDFSFSTKSAWSNGVGACSESNPPSWSETLDSVAIAANNDAPATATVDETVNTTMFSVTGSGDLTFNADGGSITSGRYNFSDSTGRVVYNLSTGDKTVTSGSDTLLLGGGSGSVSVASGKKLTLGPWGTQDGTTYTYQGGFSPSAGSTLVFAPGVGNTQKATSAFASADTGTTIVISNGTYCANRSGGGSGYFGSNSLCIEDGGVLSLESSNDLTGYNNTSSFLKINRGGTWQVKQRDTFVRSLVLNGGSVTVQGADSQRALDLYGNVAISVSANSLIQGINDGSVTNPLIYLRANGNNKTTTFTFSNGATLTNNVTYASDGNIVIAGSGTFIQNGFDNNDVTYSGTTTINSGNTFIMNATHANAGAYTVADGSRLTGTGAITGDGVVTLSGNYSKLCGSLTINKVSVSSGAMFGDQYTPLAATITGSFAIGAGTQTIQNGTLTIGPSCSVSASGATFSIAANGGLNAKNDMSVTSLTSAGTNTFAVARTAGGASAKKITTSGAATFNAGASIVLDYGEESPLVGDEVVVLDVGGTLTGIDTVSISDKHNVCRWRLIKDNNEIKAKAYHGTIFSVW